MGGNQLARSFLDGSNMTTLVSTGILSPSALAIDYVTGDVYWADVQVDAIQVGPFSKMTSSG